MATDATGGGPYTISLPITANSKIYAIYVTARVSGHTNLYYNKVYANQLTLNSITIGSYGDLGGYWLCLAI